MHKCHSYVRVCTSYCTADGMAARNKDSGKTQLLSSCGIRFAPPLACVKERGEEMGEGANAKCLRTYRKPTLCVQLP